VALFFGLCAEKPSRGRNHFIADTSQIRKFINFVGEPMSGRWAERIARQYIYIYIGLGICKS